MRGARGERGAGSERLAIAGHLWIQHCGEDGVLGTESTWTHNTYLLIVEFMIEVYVQNAVCDPNDPGPTTIHQYLPVPTSMGM